MKLCLDRFPGGVHRALTMSYDDGIDHDRRLVDIFNRHGIRGTFHLNSGQLDKPGYVTSVEVKSLYDGHEVSAHSVTHPHLTHVPFDRIAGEMWEDRKRLEELVDYPVKGMSYPYGTVNDTVANALAQLGFDYGRTVVSTGSFAIPHDLLRWNPTCHHNNQLQETFDKFLAGWRRDNMQLMYVWGHSYEFDRNDNWQLIEQFCANAGGHPDIWFATNRDIVRYLQALRRLETSADGRIVHNPSAIPVWISADGEPVLIEGGATMKL